MQLGKGGTHKGGEDAGGEMGFDIFLDFLDGVSGELGFHFGEDEILRLNFILYYYLFAREHAVKYLQ